MDEDATTPAPVEAHTEAALAGAEVEVIEDNLRHVQPAAPPSL